MRLADQLTQIPKSSRPALLLILAGIALLSMLAGFLPMWSKTRSEQQAAADLEREAVLMHLENALGAAAIEARAGRYEPARKQASKFFTDLRFQLDEGENSAFPLNERQRASQLLDGRDELITLLARGDPAGADRLSKLYLSYREMMASEQEQSGSGEAAPVGGSP